MSVRREVTLWQSSPAAYFSCVGGSEEVGTGEEEMSLLENKLQDLHIQRYVVCVSGWMASYFLLGDALSNN